MASDGLYRPITRVMFAAEWEWGGGKPGLGHWMNVLLYALTGYVLYRLLNRLTANTFLSFTASLIFIAHPIHTEVVANIKSRDEILSFLSCLFAMGSYMDYLVKKSWTGMIGSFALLFLALGSKESAITFIAVIPLMGWFFNRSKPVSEIS